MKTIWFGVLVLLTACGGGGGGGSGGGSATGGGTSSTGGGTGSTGGGSGTGGGTSATGGGTSATGGGTSATGGGTSATGGGSQDVIPDPGTATGAEWTDVEPNDRPSQAVPVGVLSNPWAGFTMPITTINSATDKDFFVFRTGDATALNNSQLLFCWSGNFNLLDMYLYSVDNQMHQGPLVHSWTATTNGCETAFQGAGSAADAGLAVNSIYLLEVRAAPGATTPTTYDA